MTGGITLALLAGLWAPAGGDWRPEPVKTADGAQLVSLSLQRCLIKEVETDPLPLRAKDAAGCTALNRATASVREPGLRRVRLEPGRYVFRVHNVDVPWAVDFHLRGAQDKGLPKTAGGAIATGQTFDYAITLTAGVYVFSSPKNGTIDYSLLVEQ